MSPLPASNLPGHARLHERATLGLDRCQESEDTEFKEPGTWDDLKWRITNAALGMGNLREGGVVLVGVSERSQNWELIGLTDTQLFTFEPDLISSHVSAYVSPEVDIDIVLVTHTDSKKYVAIHIREFRDSPLVCKKNGPANSGIVEGRVYVRLGSPPRTTIITNATQMHQLLELAAEKRARRILEVSSRIGMKPAAAAAQRYNDELAGL